MNTLRKMGAKYNTTFCSFVGLSTDTKPVGIVLVENRSVVLANGSVFIEKDTDKKYAYDAENQQWYENSINKLKTCLNAFSNDGISAKNGGKNSMKFTFNVNEGTRVDKSCNGTIPTITTSVVLGKYLKGEATCDKADYDMRQGVLEALANAVFDGNFEKAYDKAVKTNAFCERQDRTCHYCGKVFDTVEEKEAHEAWHVERKKARRERYLLRKRAKEIAFEEQAQKMAKEMIEK